MADPGGLLGADPTLDPDQQILDFLGAKSPPFQRGQPALPVTGAAAVGAPQGPVGLAGGLRLVGGTGGSGGPSGPGALGTAMSAAEDALKGIKFADLARTVFGSGPDAGAVQTPSGAFTNTAPDILRNPTMFPDFPASAVTDLPGVGIASGEALMPAGASTETGSLLGSVLGEEAGALAGEALPVVGAIPGIVMSALSDQPNWIKATDAALTSAGVIADILGGYGLGSLTAGIIEMLLPLFESGGSYIPTREKALESAKTGLGQLGGAYQQAAQSGDPAQELQALQTTESGGHIYSGLNLPPDIARQLGLETPRGAETVPVDWHSLSPQQFEQFVGLVGQQDPSVLGQWVTGSGDVPYLPQGPAQSAANQAAQDARAMLTYLSGQQQQSATEITQAPQAPAAMSPGGGATELEEIAA